MYQNMQTMPPSYPMQPGMPMGAMPPNLQQMSSDAATALAMVAPGMMPPQGGFNQHAPPPPQGGPQMWPQQGQQQQQPPPQQSMGRGRGRGRGQSNLPAWMEKK
jgi:hypothetical protein